jgi:peptide/nickel transport system substrate-binding protein
MYVMPARVAATDAFTQINDFTGSGPFRFIRAEWRAGAGAAYARFEKYVPRQEPASANAGGKLVHFDRVEWKIIPDSSTAAAALQRNEVDWLENPLIDLVPMLRSSAGVKVDVFDPLGSINMIAFNHVQPPFDNVKLRRAVLAAVDQKEYVAAYVGDQTELGRTGVGVFTLGSPYANTAGLEALTGPRNLDRARRMVAESGYAGERILLMSPSDQANIAQSAQVTNALYKSLGLNVEYASMDWGTLMQRRTSKAPADKGGWNSYCTGWAGLSVANPATHLPLRGNGPAGWNGWPVNAAMEQLRDAWFDAPDLPAQKKICEDMQRLAFQDVPFIPVCQTFAPTAFRSDLTGFMRTATPSFWGVRRV